jgi:hypothetical protein
MNTFTIQADNKNSKVLIAIFKALGVSYEMKKQAKKEETEDESPYDPEFVKMVLERAESAKRGNVVEYTPSLKEKWFGK